VDLDGLIPAGIERQQRGRGLRRRIIVEPTRDEHDAAREELLLQPALEAHSLSVLLGAWVGSKRSTSAVYFGRRAGSNRLPVRAS